MYNDIIIQLWIYQTRSYTDIKTNNIIGQNDSELSIGIP